MEEIWKDILGWEGQYQVSTLARVRSLDKWVNGAGGLKLKRGKIRKIVVSNRGYATICLSNENKKKLVTVHRLMGIAFIPNPKNKRCVRHLDDMRLNNVLSNLAWGTHKENSADKIINGNGAKWERHGMAKLSRQEAIEIKNKYNKKTCNGRHLAEIYGVSETAIMDIVKERKWIGVTNPRNK